MGSVLGVLGKNDKSPHILLHSLFSENIQELPNTPNTL
jgi:hypothetical protein